jgi:hypothetical protein
LNEKKRKKEAYIKILELHAQIRDIVVLNAHGKKNGRKAKCNSLSPSPHISPTQKTIPRTHKTWVRVGAHISPAPHLRVEHQIRSPQALGQALVGDNVALGMRDRLPCRMGSPVIRNPKTGVLNSATEKLDI